VNKVGESALLLAACHGKLEAVQWLLKEGGASIGETNHEGMTALLLSAQAGELSTLQWLLEHGGGSLTDVSQDGRIVWDLLEKHVSAPSEDGTHSDDDDDLEEDGKASERTEADPVKVAALLRVMVLRGDPPDWLVEELAPNFVSLLEEGARLRARLPAYLRQRRALLDAHCPLLAPLRALVHDYNEPMTTDELWATGLGTATKRKRPDEDDAEELLRDISAQKRRALGGSSA
jgi:hypothetical protein